MSIFYKSMLRDCLHTLLMVLGGLLLLVMIMETVKLLDQAATSLLDVRVVIPLLVLWLISHSPILLVIAVYFSVLLVFLRAHRDQEMLIWISAGVSPLALMRLAVAFSAPFAVIIALFSFYLSPWAAARMHTLHIYSANRIQLLHDTTGLFREIMNGKVVYFCDDTLAQQVPSFFAHVTFSKTDAVIVSQGVAMSTLPFFGQSIIFTNGVLYGHRNHLQDFFVARFRRCRARLAFANTSNRLFSTEHSMHVLHTVNTLANRAELMWRYSVPLSVFMLSILVIPLSSTHPRTHHSMSVTMAIMVYALYNNLLDVFQTLIAQGKISCFLGFVAAPILMGVLAIVLMLKDVVWFRRLRRAWA